MNYSSWIQMDEDNNIGPGSAAGILTRPHLKDSKGRPYFPDDLELKNGNLRSAINTLEIVLDHEGAKREAVKDGVSTIIQTAIRAGYIDDHYRPKSKFGIFSRQAVYEIHLAHELRELLEQQGLSQQIGRF